jgi:hypothetical protein
VRQHGNVPAFALDAVLAITACGKEEGKRKVAGAEDEGSPGVEEEGVCSALDH